MFNNSDDGGGKPYEMDGEISGNLKFALCNRILKGGVVIPLIFPKAPRSSQTESVGFPRKHHESSCLDTMGCWRPKISRQH